ncbi:hypothetical protein JW906_00190 [bacterium]|nr:hypothetical protein [bacterium]
MFLKRGLAVAGLAGLLLAGQGLALDDVPKGIVVDAKTRKPVPRARIQYHLDAEEGQKFGVVTDANGGFYMIGINPMKLSLFLLYLDVEADGYQRKQETVYPDPAGNPDIRVELEPAPPLVQEFVPVSNRDRMEEIGKTLNMEFGGKLGFYPQDQKSGILVRDTRENVARARALIAQSDVPPRQIWLQLLLIEADGQGGGRNVPDDPEFRDLQGKLKSLFKFQTYNVIGRADIHGQENASFSIMQDAGQTGKAAFAVRSGRLEWGGSSVRLRDLTITVQKPVHSEISTTVNVPLGDTVVLGSSKGGTQDHAVIAVVKVSDVR